MRIALFALLGLTACGAPNEPEQRERAEAPPTHTGASAPTTAAVEGYRVSVEAPANAIAGQPSIAWVHVNPHAPWHMNVDYPVKLQMRGPSGVRLDAALLHKSDAERLDDTALVFPVMFTPNRGHHGHTTLTGEVHFAVCGDAECAPVQVPVQFSVEVT